MGGGGGGGGCTTTISYSAKVRISLQNFNQSVSHRIWEFLGKIVIRPFLESCEE